MNRSERVFGPIAVALLILFFHSPPAVAFDTGCFKSNAALTEFFVGNGFNFDVRAKDARGIYRLDRTLKTASGPVYINPKLYDEVSGVPLELGFYRCGFYPNNGQLRELHKAVRKVYTEAERDEAIQYFVRKFGSKTSCATDPKKWYIVHEGRFLIVDVGVVRLNLWTWLISLSVEDVSKDVCKDICREVWSREKSSTKRGKPGLLQEEIAKQFKFK